MTVNVEMEAAHRLLNELGEGVRQGLCLTDGLLTIAGGMAVELSTVHPAHAYGEVFNGWVDLYDSRGPLPEFRVLEVLLPPDAFCPEHRRLKPYLAGPTANLDRPHPNRRQRRTHHHHR